MMNWIKRYSLPLAVLAALLIGLAWYMWRTSHAASENNNQTPTAKPALSVEVIQAQSTMMHGNLIANGNIAAWQEAVIGAEVSGLVLRDVLVNVGDKVRRGQVIARFNDSTIQADLAQAQANLAEAQANLNEAAANAKRAREVEGSGALSQQQVDQYVVAETSANAKVQSAQAALQAQQIRLKQTSVIAPDDGVISKRDATVGQVAAAGTELFRLIRQGRVEWRGEFNSVDISKVMSGMAVTLTLPDGHVVAGKVRMQAPTTDGSTRNTLVYVDVESQQAKPGMFAKGTIALLEKPVTALPYSAIVMRDGFSYLMQVDAKQHIRQLKVRLGQRSGNLVEILDSLDPQARFVASGGAFLAEGDLVHVISAQ